MINKVILVGNVGSDPDVRSTESYKIATFRMATNKRIKNKATGDFSEKTSWHRIVTFGNLAGSVDAYVKKGMKIYVEGEIETRKFIDKDGKDRFVTEILASTVKFLDNKAFSQSEGSASGESKNSQSIFDDRDEDDDWNLSDEIPF